MPFKGYYYAFHENNLNEIKNFILGALEVDTENEEAVKALYQPLCNYWNTHPSVPKDLQCAEYFEVNYIDEFEKEWRSIDSYAHVPPFRPDCDMQSYTAIFTGPKTPAIAIFFMKKPFINEGRIDIETVSGESFTCYGDDSIYEQCYKFYINQIKDLYQYNEAMVNFIF